MNIILDGKNLDFSLENEKNCFEIINSIEKWLESNNFFILNLKIDGKNQVIDNSLEKIKTDNVKEISISTVTDSAIKCADLTEIENYFFNLIAIIEENKREEKEKNDAVLSHLEQYSEIKKLLEFAIDKIYNSNSLGYIETMVAKKDFINDDYEGIKEFAKNIIIIAQKRKNEILFTQEEIKNEKKFFETFQEEISTISVLLQTGKDKEAMEKVIKFIDFSKKMFRLISYYNMSTRKIAPEDINNYNKLLNELGEAILKSDSVLIGDLLEYELVPTIEGFFNIISE